jgi:hypothetical protein
MFCKARKDAKNARLARIVSTNSDSSYSHSQ